MEAMEAYDEALNLFGDSALTSEWNKELGRMLEDEQVVPLLSGFNLRRLHDRSTWELSAVSVAYERHTLRRTPQHAGEFLEGFLHGGAEVLLQDEPLLQMLDAWLCTLEEDEFLAALPVLRRSLSSFDTTARRRALAKLERGPQQSHGVTAAPARESNEAFAAALPLLYSILGMKEPA
jgi:hypothetical protein